MNEAKPVVWFADEPTPSTFFFHSPFRSWKFLVNTCVLAALFIGLAIVIYEHRDRWSSQSHRLYWCAFILVTGGLYPYLRALKRRVKISELYLAGKLCTQQAESPIDDVLEVAENAINDGLFYTSTTIGLFLFAVLVTLFK